MKKAVSICIIPLYSYEDMCAEANGDLVEETKRPVFLEDLESYKNNFDPAAPCEVFDLEIQDEVLKPLYVGLPPLPSDRWILTTYDPKNACNPEAGGRLSFSSWAKHSKDLNAVTVWNIMTFVQSGIYINPCRISPALCSTEQSGQNAAARRITIDKKTVISVMVGMCTESYLTEAVAGNGSDPRYKRYMHILQHNQEWERWQAFHCLVFGYEILYSHINENAIQLSSVLSTSAKIVKAGSSSFKDSVSSDMIGPSKSSKSPSPSKGPPKPSYSYQFRPPGSVRYTLSHDEAVPAFDARGAQIDFNKDIGNLAAILPAWAGEIPVGSFVIAGYTAGTFRGQVATQEKKNLMCLGCNLVWVVVCGTPKRRS
ncbi:hypothetical protein C8J57DRAFT_1303567 [Mycena rebaudengoi]|nr:hypothetical protein C8J57DRAFT_1303567 [Mycena rebaudengoi]